MKKFLMWITVNSIFVGCLIAGFFFGYDGLLNIAGFYAWFLSIMVWFLFIPEAQEKLIAKGQRMGSVPSWLNTTVDLFIVALFVYHTYFVIAIFYTIHIFAQSTARDQINAGIDEKEGK